MPPEENIQTIQFINSLDPSRFSEFKTTIRNLSKLGVKASTTLVDALSRATTYDPILINSSPSEANESVFYQRSFQRGRGRHHPRRKSTQPSQYSEAPQEYQPRSQRPQRLEPRSQPFSSSSSSSSAGGQNNVQCSSCGRFGHTSRTCRSKRSAGRGDRRPMTYNDHVSDRSNRSRQERISLLQQIDNEDNIEEIIETIFMTQKGELPKDPSTDFNVILDNGATASLIRNPNLLKDIRTVGLPTTVRGINGNGDGLIVEKTGIFDPFGEVLHHPGASANLFSLSKVRLNHDVKFDSMENTFIVSNNETTYKFKANNGLYTCNFQPHASSISLSNSDEAYAISHDNKQQFKATLVKMIQKRLGFISDQALVKAIVDSSIRNLPLDIKDVPLARKINGPDVETLKGKSRSLDPKFPHRSTFLESPQEIRSSRWI
jgi:hypothetical protein